MHPVDFVRTWTGVTRTERFAAQEHFLQLCAVIDVPIPAEVEEDVILARLLALNKGRASR